MTPFFCVLAFSYAFFFIFPGIISPSFSPVDSDIMLISARTSPPLIIAYHLQRKSTVFTMPLSGWPRPLHSFVTPPYASPIIALVSCLGPDGKRGGRLLGLLDLQTGKEIIPARQMIQTQNPERLLHCLKDDDYDDGVCVAFGCNAMPRIADQMLVMGQGPALLVFGNVSKNDVNKS